MPSKRREGPQKSKSGPRPPTADLIVSVGRAHAPDPPRRLPEPSLLPSQLAHQRRWVVRGGSSGKLPIRLDTNSSCKWQDGGWGDLYEALVKCHADVGLAGVGFVFAGADH